MTKTTERVKAGEMREGETRRESILIAISRPHTPQFRLRNFWNTRDAEGNGLRENILDDI